MTALSPTASASKSPSASKSTVPSVLIVNAPPFEPQLVDAERGKRIVARGAVDDKGQVMTWLEALRAWHGVNGAPPCEVTVLLEGEEETGSPSLEPFLEANKEELARADVAIVCVGAKSGLVPDTTVGEASDAMDLDLPGVQSELIAAVAATGTERRGRSSTRRSPRAPGPVGRGTSSRASQTTARC